jgi:hypothetical protein
MYSLKPQFDGEGPGLTPSAAVTSNAAASPVSVAQSSSMYSQGPAVSSSAQGTAPTPSAPKAIDKSKWNTGVKVPQTTVDAVKAAGKGNMGVNAATKAAGMGKGNAGAGADAKYDQKTAGQYQEAVRRVYPNAYAQAATQAANKAASGRPNSPYGFGGAPSKPKPSVNEDGKNSRAAKPSVNEDGRNSRAANKTKPFPSFMPNPRGAAGQSPFIPVK